MSALTDREREVMRLVANGNTNAGIGQQLGRHRCTVDWYLTGIYRALDARDRAHAVAICLRRGEIGVDDIHLPGQQQEAAA